MDTHPLFFALLLPSHKPHQYILVSGSSHLYVLIIFPCPHQMSSTCHIYNYIMGLAGMATGTITPIQQSKIIDTNLQISKTILFHVSKV